MADATGSLCTIAATILTVGGTVTGTWAVGQTVAGAGVLPGTMIVSLGTGSGGVGTYNLNDSQTVSVAEAMTGTFVIWVETTNFVSKPRMNSSYGPSRLSLYSPPPVANIGWNDEENSKLQAPRVVANRFGAMALGDGGVELPPQLIYRWVDESNSKQQLPRQVAHEAAGWLTGDQGDERFTPLTAPIIVVDTLFEPPRPSTYRFGGTVGGDSGIERPAFLNYVWVDEENSKQQLFRVASYREGAHTGGDGGTELPPQLIYRWVDEENSKWQTPQLDTYRFGGLAFGDSGIELPQDLTNAFPYNYGFGEIQLPRPVSYRYAATVGGDPGNENQQQLSASITFAWTQIEAWPYRRLGAALFTGEQGDENAFQLTVRSAHNWHQIEVWPYRRYGAALFTGEQGDENATPLTAPTLPGWHQVEYQFRRLRLPRVEPQDVVYPQGAPVVPYAFSVAHSEVPYYKARPSYSPQRLSLYSPPPVAEGTWPAFGEPWTTWKNPGPFRGGLAQRINLSFPDWFVPLTWEKNIEIRHPVYLYQPTTLSQGQPGLITPFIADAPYAPRFNRPLADIADRSAPWPLTVIPPAALNWGFEPTLPAALREWFVRYAALDFSRVDLADRLQLRPMPGWDAPWSPPYLRHRPEVSDRDIVAPLPLVAMAGWEPHELVWYKRPLLDVNLRDVPWPLTTLPVAALNWGFEANLPLPLREWFARFAAIDFSRSEVAAPSALSVLPAWDPPWAPPFKRHLAEFSDRDVPWSLTVLPTVALGWGFEAVLPAALRAWFARFAGVDQTRFDVPASLPLLAMAGWEPHEFLRFRWPHVELNDRDVPWSGINPVFRPLDWRDTPQLIVPRPKWGPTTITAGSAALAVPLGWEPPWAPPRFARHANDPFRLDVTWPSLVPVPGNWGFEPDLPLAYYNWLLRSAALTHGFDIDIFGFLVPYLAKAIATDVAVYQAKGSDE